MPGKRSAYAVPVDAASAAQRRRLARDYFYRTAHSRPGCKFVEVDAEVAGAVRAMARGKELHHLRDRSHVHAHHHARMASLRALADGHIDAGKFKCDEKVYQRANAAKHGPVAVPLRPPWADAADDSEAASAPSDGRGGVLSRVDAACQTDFVDGQLRAEAEEFIPLASCPTMGGWASLVAAQNATISVLTARLDELHAAPAARRLRMLEGQIRSLAANMSSEVKRHTGATVRAQVDDLLKQRDTEAVSEIAALRGIINDGLDKCSAAFETRFEVLEARFQELASAGGPPGDPSDLPSRCDTPQVGDVVELRGLRDASLNGVLARVVSLDAERLGVQFLDSARRVSVRYDKCVLSSKSRVSHLSSGHPAPGGRDSMCPDGHVTAERFHARTHQSDQMKKLSRPSEAELARRVAEASWSA